MIINGYDIVLSSEVKKLLLNYDEKLYAPKKENIFKALELSSLKDTKIVIIGQDPYPTLGDAMGLSFSISRNGKLPKSLINIYKELEANLGIVKSSGDLTNIAIQGVLFLNTVLTVEIGLANSHKNLNWQLTTNNIIKQLSERGEVIFVLLGREAQKLEKLIDLTSNTIIKTSHPSPLGVYRGFSGSNIFNDINSACNKYNYEVINWED